MGVKIDVDWLVLKAATYHMQNSYQHESVCLVKALQEQLGDINLRQLFREQVKDYKKLTMWKD
jgi:hypothetical protein